MKKLRTAASNKNLKRAYVRPTDRGLGTNGGGWNLTQASAWSGIGEKSLRAMAKRNEIPCFKIGRRFLIPRQGFIDWFNRQTGSAA